MTKFEIRKKMKNVLGLIQLCVASKSPKLTQTQKYATHDAIFHPIRHVLAESINI